MKQKGGVFPGGVVGQVPDRSVVDLVPDFARKKRILTSGVTEKLMARAHRRNRHGGAVQLDDREHLPGEVGGYGSAIFSIDEKLDRPVGGDKLQSNAVPGSKPVEREAEVVADDFAGNSFVVSLDDRSFDPNGVLPETEHSGRKVRFRK